MLLRTTAVVSIVRLPSSSSAHPIPKQIKLNVSVPGTAGTPYYVHNTSMQKRTRPVKYPVRYSLSNTTNRFVSLKKPTKNNDNIQNNIRHAVSQEEKLVKRVEYHHAVRRPNLSSAGKGPVNPQSRRPGLPRKAVALRLIAAPGRQLFSAIFPLELPTGIKPESTAVYNFQVINPKVGTEVLKGLTCSYSTTPYPP